MGVSAKARARASYPDGRNASSDTSNIIWSRSVLYTETIAAGDRVHGSRRPAAGCSYAARYRYVAYDE